jgi:propionate CoA-transferase
MGLRAALLALPLAARFKYDVEKNILFLNFEKLEVETLADVERIRENVVRLCEPLGNKVYAIVNYDDFTLQRDVEDAYLEMVQDVVKRFYLGVTRYTTSSFMRAKLGASLARRNVAPHVYETEEEALKNLVASV